MRQAKCATPRKATVGTQRQERRHGHSQPHQCRTNKNNDSIPTSTRQDHQPVENTHQWKRRNGIGGHRRGNGQHHRHHHHHHHHPHTTDTAVCSDQIIRDSSIPQTITVRNVFSSKKTQYTQACDERARALDDGVCIHLPVLECESGLTCVTCCTLNGAPMTDPTDGSSSSSLRPHRRNRRLASTVGTYSTAVERCV